MSVPLLLLAVGVPTSSAVELSLDAYLATYRENSNLLPIRRLDVEIADVQIQRVQKRATQELSVGPDVGARLYHHAASSDVELLGEVGGVAQYVYQGNDGERLSVAAQALVPTAPGRVGRTIRYGVDGTFFLPLLRNFGGREFGYQIASAERQRAQTEQRYRQEELLYCADAAERYVVRYATQQQLEAYEALLAEKKRVWYRTASDYKKKLITRLDLLSAKSDWIFAQTLTPGFEQRRGRADAALRAFAPLPADVTLAEPPRLVVATGDLSAHPQMKALDALRSVYEAEIELAEEQGAQELDLALTLGVDRFHDVFDPNGAGISDTTDLHGLVGVRYLWPIARPEIDYRVTILGRQLDQIEEQRLEVLRSLTVGIERAKITVKTEQEAYRLIEEQLAVLRSQIRAAYEEFRAGKQEFQNYLDHWDRYQRAKLEIWDRWLSLRLAELALIPLSGVLPEACRAPPR